MHPNVLYKVKHQSGRILGPLDLERVRKLILKNQITGVELAKEYPLGEWQDINQLPELAEFLLRHAAGTLEKSGAALKSDQSSYRPILSPTREHYAPTVVLSQPVLKPAAEPNPVPLELESAPSGLEATRVPLDDSDKTWVELESAEQTKTELVANDEKFSIQFSGKSKKGEGRKDLVVSEENYLPDALADPKYKKLVLEATIALNRPGLVAPKKRLRLPDRKELFRIILVSAALGYFGYDSFLKEQKNSATQFLKRSEQFRPSFPKKLNAVADPAAGLKLYADGLKYFSLDHVRGYKAAAVRFSQAATTDPENIKAYAMLASAYVNLIETSTKDETFFQVISQLIDAAKAKGVDVPEVIIAEAEFRTITGRPDAAIQRIVDYTKGKTSFDPSLFIYIAEAFLAKGKAADASKYIQNFPDNQVWSPRIYYLRGRISEELGDVPKAFENYEKALNGWPTHAKSRLRKVFLSWKGGNISGSSKDLKQVLSEPELLSPSDLGQANYLLSQYYSVKQDFQSALDSIERALYLDKHNRDYLLEYYTLRGREGSSIPGAKGEARMFFYLLDGEKQLKQGQIGEALGMFLRARAENPHSIQPLIKIGDMFLQLNDLVNARMNYQKAAAMEPNSIEVWSKYISVLIQSYEWEDAQKAMDKIRQVQTSASSIDKAAGDMYAKQGRYPEAAQYYKKSMSRDSIDPDVYVAYGKILMAVKSFKDAPFFFTLARRLDPLSTEPIILIAKAIAEVEGPDVGIQFLKDELQKSGAARPELLAAIAELEIRKGQWSAAQEYVDQARELNPDYAFPWKLQAQIFLNDENTDKKALDRALEAFKSYSDRNSSDPSGYLERYRIFMKKAQFEKAEAELEKIYAIYPKYPNLHLYKGMMYTNMGNHKVAAVEYATELKNNPGSATTLVFLGKAYLELGSAKEALTHLVKAMGLQPQNAEAKIFAAVANHRMKNYTGAIALFRAAIQLDAGNPQLYKRMGECFRDMGDVINTRASFQKYLQMEPDASDKAEIERYL